MIVASLNEKQKRFAEEYMIDLNATQAAIRSGYSTHTAQRIGSELLSKPLIRAYVDEMRAEESKRTGVTVDRIVRELAKLGFANAEDVIDLDSATVRHDASRVETSTISSVKVKTTTGAYGDTVEREVKMHDKLKALEQLGKHFGMFTEKVELRGGVQIDDARTRLIEKLSEKGDA